MKHLIIAVMMSAITNLFADSLAVDFRYMPPEWQTSICLPDDPHKTLVDKSGELLYHYREGGREFGLHVSIQAASNTIWKKQELHSPRVPIVRTYQSANELEIVEEAFAMRGSSRNDVILVHVRNTSSTQRIIHPQLMVDTPLSFDFRPDIQRVVINSHETVTTSLRMTGITENKQRRTIQLESLTLAAGKTVTFFVLYSSSGTIELEPATIKQAMASRDRVVEYWKKTALPFDRIQVPDAGIQALLYSSIRNIWQAREIKNGLPAFQVGPTCYRGLWIVDGAFLLEAATMLGAGDQARNGVAYELTFQKADGRIEVMKDYSKENGIVLWTCVRHARLTQGKAWLESIWPNLERIAEHIKVLRKQTLLNELSDDDGLVPPGFPDGGIGGIHYEYTNPYWNLVGLHSFIQAARWLGKTEQASEWQKEYDDFMASFRKAASRDMKTDPHGNRYLPIRMDGKDLPQRGQWGFCHGVYPGQLFAKDDPLVIGNMKMLKATEREGMVYGTGWDSTGIWNYFASFYGHAWLWQGNGRKAAQVLYAFANHAAPLLAWREEQSLKGEKYKKVGDMPHNWASAEFIRLAIHLLALDRGDELHLFEGLPAAWTKSGMITKLEGIATPFGPLTMILQISKDGKTADLHLEPMSDLSCRKIVVHLAGWANAKDNTVIELDPHQAHHRQIPIKLIP